MQHAESSAESSDGNEFKEDDFLAPLPTSTGNKSKATTTTTSITDELNSESTHSSETGYTMSSTGGDILAPAIAPLPSLTYGYDDVFAPLVLVGAQQRYGMLSLPEKHVLQLFEQQQCVVKTIKNTEWTQFLQRFRTQQSLQHNFPTAHDDRAPHDSYLYNSFYTSTSLLPPSGKKMRCYGSPTLYTVGVVFELPSSQDTLQENESITTAETWAWPAGYSAKTEFNIDSHGRLTHGRQEALVSFQTLRQYNQEYCLAGSDDPVFIGTKRATGIQIVPYNEVYVRVGGTHNPKEKSLEQGIGLPVALFVRLATYGHLITMLRTKARLIHVFQENPAMKDIPLLLVTPEHGVQILTHQLQDELWKDASSKLNPFQNQTVAYRTTLRLTEAESFQQKVEELLQLDDNIQSLLTPEELAHIAGGFGATDKSLAHILQMMMQTDHRIDQEQSESDQESRQKSHRLQDFVNEGLSSALRAGDYHTSRQLLLLYSLVSSHRNELDADQKTAEKSIAFQKPHLIRQDEPMHRHVLENDSTRVPQEKETLERDMEIVKRATGKDVLAFNASTISSSLPPALDTDRLRSATNSDGLLAVLGAAQVLRVIQDGSALRRIHESVDAIEEWINHGEHNVAFRISSWHDQRTAQGDLKIATAQNSKFMAFVSNKAIANRKAFASQLREAISANDFTGMHILYAIHGMLQRMHSPCLRLELLQYVLGLDNRYSVLHISRSIELAATCLDISTR
ncbi:hypothetical protein FisN_23Lh036 [Fistulifera solaris]|uniref:Uncharacterized protein n=1 Tax=Fistulifera solaris TaxID=1519565 RepID=A0A1Z5KKB1_FISSO|nr:hypothetical protein FisN_23Lh036 [Fistulifera solaris]|eukprot:GAX26512.1 hypothetical protein FisN_23Lh036 [Fistulifera solaris]